MDGGVPKIGVNGLNGTSLAKTIMPTYYENRILMHCPTILYVVAGGISPKPTFTAIPGLISDYYHLISRQNSIPFRKIS
jgi:hypothetical protein